MALFPCNINLGSDTVFGVEVLDNTLGTAGTADIHLGFKPKKLIAMLMSGATPTHIPWSYSVYDEDASATQFSRWVSNQQSSAAPTTVNIGQGSTYCLDAINDDGFTFKGASTNLYVLWYAASKS